METVKVQIERIFRTPEDYEIPTGEFNSGERVTTSKGFIPLSDRIKQYEAAGERLADWREEHFDYDGELYNVVDESDTVVYNDIMMSGDDLWEEAHKARLSLRATITALNKKQEAEDAGKEDKEISEKEESGRGGRESSDRTSLQSRSSVGTVLPDKKNLGGDEIEG